MFKKYFKNNRKQNGSRFLGNGNFCPRQNTPAEIKYLTKIANKPCGLVMLEKYKEAMRFRVNWENIDPSIVKQHIEKLIKSKKNSFTISDML